MPSTQVLALSCSSSVFLRPLQAVTLSSVCHPVTLLIANTSTYVISLDVFSWWWLLDNAVAQQCSLELFHWMKMGHAFVFSFRLAVIQLPATN